MIDRIDTHSLHGQSLDLEPLAFLRTIFIPSQKITATASISALTIGFERVGDEPEYQMGFVGAAIRKAGFSPAPGRSDDIPELPPWAWASRNGVTVDKCTYVTFVLVVRKAEAEALCTIAFYDQPGQKTALKPPAKPKKLVARALVLDKKSGLIRAVHHLDAIEGARVPSERFLAQAIKKCAAAELKAEPRTLEVVFHDEPQFRYQPRSRFDRKARRIRASNS